MYILKATVCQSQATVKVQNVSKGFEHFIPNQHYFIYRKFLQMQTQSSSTKVIELSGLSYKSMFTLYAQKCSAVVATPITAPKAVIIESSRNSSKSSQAKEVCTCRLSPVYSAIAVVNNFALLKYRLASRCFT